MTTSPLAQLLKLPCGAVLPNRIAKSAMTEGLADKFDCPAEQLMQLYETWSLGGTGSHITGNQLWVQLNHPGRQCPRIVNSQPLSPSEVQLVPDKGFWGNNSSANLIKAINSFGQVGFYYWQIILLGKGLKPDPKPGVFNTF